MNYITDQIGGRQTVLYSSPQGVQNTSLIKASTRATSRQPEDGSTSYLRGRPLYSMALPDMKHVGRGFTICRGRRPIVTCIKLMYAMFFYDYDTSYTTRCDVQYDDHFDQNIREQPLVAGNLSPRRRRIHIVSSRPPSIFNGLARHEAGWSWVDHMSRWKAHRHMYCAAVCFVFL